jgi:hypothetical protein
LDAQHHYAARDLRWCGDQFCLRGRVVASIEPDSDWRGLWRVRLPDGGLSIGHGRDAARVLALEVLNRPQAPARSTNVTLRLHLGTSRSSFRSWISAHGGQGRAAREARIHVALSDDRPSGAHAPWSVLL